MSDLPQSPSDYRDDINLSDLIAGLARSVRLMLAHWKGFSLCAILAIGSLLLWQKYQMPSYTASLSFILSDDNNSQFSGMSAVLGQLGIPINSGKYNVDKLLEIARRRKIIQSTIFQQVELSGDKDYMANHIIRKYALSEKWQEQHPEMMDFQFTNNDFDSFSTLDNFALKSLYQLIVGKENGDKNALFTYDYGREDYIMYLNFTSVDPDLSIAFVNNCYDQLVQFYAANTSTKQQETYTILKEKRDSISIALNQISQQLSRAQDRTLGAVDNSQSAYISRLQSDKFILQTGLGKAEENLNLAEITLRRNLPLIQLLDRPIGPIKPTSHSFFRTLALGLLIGGAIYGMYLFIQLILRIE